MQIISPLRHKVNPPATISAATVIAICLFSQLGALGLVGPDEPRYAWIARAMAESGDWVTPKLWGVPWFEKPVLYYWAAAAGFAMHLPAEWAARLPSAIAALASALAIAFLGFKFYCHREDAASSPGLLAPVIFSTSVAAVGFARAATPDMLFSTAITLAMASAACLMARQGALRVADPESSHGQKSDALILTLWGAFLALGVLAKGPAAVILAGGAVGMWALATSHWRATIRLAHPIALASFCVVALPWYVLCALRNPDFLHVFIFQHNFERYLTPLFQHVQPFWFFTPVILLALLPWTIFLIPVAQEGLQLWREKSCSNSPGFFIASWAVFPVLFFSFSQSKLPSYILPAIPALSLLIALGAIRAFQKPRIHAIYLTAAIALFWLSLAISFFFAASRIRAMSADPAIPSSLPPATIVIAILLAATLVFAGSRRNLRMAVGICALSVVAALLTANSIVLPRLDAAFTARPVGALLQNDLHPNRIFTFHLRRAENFGLAFYLRREIPEWSPADPDPALVLTTHEGFEKIQQAGRFRGTLDQPPRGIRLVPIAPAPR